MCSRSVSVVISRPTADSDTYEPLDGDYIEQTWDKILSDESSFNSSFDDYSGSETIDGPYESTNEPPRKHPGHASSPYFASQKPSEKHSVSKGQISKIGSESDDKSVETDTNTLITPNLVSGRRLIEELETDHALDELEAKAFELVDADTHGRLVRYIAERPFFKRDEYPVKRSERREFVYDIRRAITEAELGEDTKERIIAYIKKLYLTACGRGHLCDNGSEYGEEIDDNPAGYSCMNPISSDNPRVLNPSKRKARNLKKRRLRKTRKASSAYNLRDTAIDSQEHSQSIDIAVRKKSKPVTAANTSSGTYDFFDLDF